MKKVGIIIGVLFISVFGILCFWNEKRRNIEEFYVLPQAKSFVYYEDGKMSFEFYMNQKDSIVCYKEQNQYSLKAEEFTFSLTNVDIEIVRQKEMNLVILTSDILNIPNEEMYFSSVILEIKNRNYTLELPIGSLSILNPKGYTLLNIDDFYGSYSYLNQSLELVGINITFHDRKKKINQVRIGQSLYGDLENAEANWKLENEIDISTILPLYNPFKIKLNTELSLESNTYFIPFCYKELLFVYEGYVCFIIDDEKYYLDTFRFIVNELKYEDYKIKMKKGKVVYD